MTQFTAELKEVKMKKQMLDSVFVIKLETEQSNVLELAALPADTLLKVIIEPEKQSG